MNRIKIVRYLYFVVFWQIKITKKGAILIAWIDFIKSYTNIVYLRGLFLGR